MKIENIDVNQTVENVRSLLKKDKKSSPALVAAVELLLITVALLCNKLTLNSKNSSKPPSTDPLGKKDNKLKKKSGKKNNKGGQNGHKGSTLDPVDNPDEIKNIKIDKRTLPKGSTYHNDGYAARLRIRQVCETFTD